MSAPIEFTPGNVKAATAGYKSSDLWNVPFEDIYVDPDFNVRASNPEELEAHIESIKVSIFENGYDRTMPMGGFVAKIGGVDRVVLVDGHCRYEALSRAIAEGAEVATVPFVTKERGTSTEDLIVGLVTSNSGRQLTPYEIGIVCKRLASFGWDNKKIGNKIGRTAEYVGDLIALHGFPKKIREMVRLGQVSANTAIQAVAKHGDKAAAVLAGALADAEKAGKKKVTSSDPADAFKKACKKAAPKMFEALASVQGDPGWKHLSEASQYLIEQALEGLPEEPQAEESTE